MNISLLLKTPHVHVLEKFLFTKMCLGHVEGLRETIYTDAYHLSQFYLANSALECIKVLVLHPIKLGRFN